MKSLFNMLADEIRQLDPEDWKEGLYPQATEHIFKSVEGFYMNNGDFSKPHVELTTGLHSNGYINCAQVFQFPNLRRIMAYEMARVWRISRFCADISASDWVVGSDTSATALAGDLAEIMGCRHGVLKKGPEPEKNQIWLGEMVDHQVVERFIQSEERVLHIEELMTTAFTAEQVRKGIGEAHKERSRFWFFPVILVLMYRSNMQSVGGSRILKVNQFDIKNWDPKEYCPYCDHDSLLVKKPKQNWTLLTGQAA